MKSFLRKIIKSEEKEKHRWFKLYVIIKEQVSKQLGDLDLEIEIKGHI